MSRLQTEKIKELQLQVRDFKERLEFKCFDCTGQERHGGGWDCEMDNCPFYEIRPKSVYYGKRIPSKFRHSVFQPSDIEPGES